MSNGILKRGTYTFGEDYKLVAGSYIAPRKSRQKRKAVISRRMRRSFSIRDSLKRMKHKKLMLTTLIAAMLLVVAVFVVEAGKHSNSVNQNPGVYEGTNIKVTLPEYTEDVLLCSKAAKLEYDGELALKTAVEAGNPYRPFVFEYSLTNCSGTLLIGEREDFDDAKQYDLPESKQQVEIHNLKVDTTYYYKVVAGGQEYLGDFHTATSTRFVYIPGLVNTRDIGGGMTLDGNEIKQGLLIRGVELDGLVNSAYFIPADELENVRGEFGFVYDLDLRASSIYSGTYTSRLNVPHRFYAAPMYGEIFNKAYRASIKQIFSDLADPKKYPMYLHCTWGQDRTGTIIFLLQGVLNVSEEEMKQEYLLTSYVNPSLAESDNMDVVTSGLESYAGDTLQEKIVTYLTTEIGVTEAEIASIRSVFLEEGTS